MFILIEMFKSFGAVILKNWKIFLAVIILTTIIAMSYHKGVENTNKIYEKKIATLILDSETAHKKFEADSKKISSEFEMWKQEHPQLPPQEITKYVSKYISKTADSKCIIPLGWVLATNTAASNTTEKPIDSRTISYDSPSGVTLAESAETIVENYQICNIEMKKLSTLQDVVKAYQKSQNQ